MCYLCLVLVSGWRWPHRMHLEAAVHLQIFFSNIFRIIGVNSSLNVIESVGEVIWSWELSEILKSQFQFQYLWLICLYFLFFPGSILKDCIFLRISSFLLGGFIECPFYWWIVSWKSLFWSFVFLWCLLQLLFHL